MLLPLLTQKHLRSLDHNFNYLETAIRDVRHHTSLNDDDIVALAADARQFSRRLDTAEKILQTGVHESEMKSAVNSIMELRAQLRTFARTISNLALSLVDLKRTTYVEIADYNRRLDEIYARMGVTRQEDKTSQSPTGYILVPNEPSPPAAPANPLAKDLCGGNKPYKGVCKGKSAGNGPVRKGQTRSGGAR